MREGTNASATIRRAVAIASVLISGSCGSGAPSDESAVTSTAVDTGGAEAEADGIDVETDGADATEASDDEPDSADDPNEATEAEDAAGAGEVTDIEEPREGPGPDDWILDAPERGALIVDGEVIGTEGETTVSLHPEEVVPISTTAFGDATVVVSYLLPHYDIDRVEVTMPDGTILDLGTPSIGYPSTAVTIEAEVQSGPSEGSSVAVALTNLAGSTSIEIDENRATISGTIGWHTSAQINYLAEEYPNVDTLVLADVPGAVEDHIDQTFGRVDPWFSAEFAADAVRHGGFTTLLPIDGVVSDRGLLLFAGGTERIVETEGDHAAALDFGTLSVRAACCGVSPDDSIEYDQYSAVHQHNVAQWSRLLGETPGTGLALYLARASADGPLRLTAAEIDFFELTTEPLVLSRSFGPDPVSAEHELVGPAVDQTVTRPDELVEIVVDAFNARQAEVEEGAALATALVTFDAEQPVAHILIEGALDDAIGGEVATLVFDGDDEFGWVVTEVHHRWICSRALSGDVCL